MENNIRERYSNFVEELEELSVKYGVTIQSIGGVLIFTEPLMYMSMQKCCFSPK